MAVIQEIKPQAGPQEIALSSRADIVIAGGAAGVGKTWALLLEPLRHISNPQFGAVFFRRTMPQITNIGGLWDEAKKLYPMMGGVPKQNPMSFVFPEESRISFSHLQHDQDKEAWAGAQVPLLCFDQLEQFLESQFWFLITRNRSMSGIRPYVRATCNPVPEDDPIGGWLHKLISWWLDEDTGYPRWERSGVIRWFVRIAEVMYWADSRRALIERFSHLPAEDIQPKSLTFVPGRLEHNKKLMAVDPGYRANLLAQSLVLRERLLGGNWKIKPSAGKVFNRAWFPIIDVMPSTVGARRIRYWDKAGTEDGGKRTAGVRMVGPIAGDFIIEDVVKGQWSALNRETVIKDVADADAAKFGRGAVEIWVEQEPGSGGKESAESTVMNLAGHTIRAERVTGDKMERADPLSAQAEARHVKLLRGDWNEAFLAEAHDFEPKATFKDQIDAAAGAFNKLTLTFKPKRLKINGF